MLRVPPLVVTAMSSVPGAAARCADSMMAPVTVGELFGLMTMIFTDRFLPVPMSASGSSHNLPRMAAIVRSAGACRVAKSRKQGEKPMATVIVRDTGSGFAQDIVVGRHHLKADEPADAGGADTGPSPY